MAHKKVWKPQGVEVEWLDAASYSTFNGTLADMVQRGKLRQRFTKGYLIHQDGEEVVSPTLRRTVLAHDYDPPQEESDEPEVGNLTTIPSMWVIAIRSDKRKSRKSKASPVVSEPLITPQKEPTV